MNRTTRPDVWIYDLKVNIPFSGNKHLGVPKAKVSDTWTRFKQKKNSFKIVHGPSIYTMLTNDFPHLFPFISFIFPNPLATLIVPNPPHPSFLWKPSRTFSSPWLTLTTSFARFFSHTTTVVPSESVALVSTPPVRKLLHHGEHCTSSGNRQSSSSP